MRFSLFGFLLLLIALSNASDPSEKDEEQNVKSANKTTTNSDNESRTVDTDTSKIIISVPVLRDAITESEFVKNSEVRTDMQIETFNERDVFMKDEKVDNDADNGKKVNADNNDTTDWEIKKGNDFETDTDDLENSENDDESDKHATDTKKNEEIVSKSNEKSGTVKDENYDKESKSMPHNDVLDLHARYGDSESKETKDDFEKVDDFEKPLNVNSVVLGSRRSLAPVNQPVHTARGSFVPMHVPILTYTSQEELHRPVPKFVTDRNPPDFHRHVSNDPFVPHNSYPYEPAVTSQAPLTLQRALSQNDDLFAKLLQASLDPSANNQNEKIRYYNTLAPTFHPISLPVPYVRRYPTFNTVLRSFK